MNFFDLFYPALLKEMKHFNLNLEEYKTSVSELTATLDVSFISAYNRCAYLYRYASCNVHFITDCVEKFKSEYSNFNELITYWKSLSDTNVCSISCGPGLDYLSFITAICKDVKEPIFKTNYILSKDGAWRNTVGFISSILEENSQKFNEVFKMNYSNIKVVQGDLSRSIPAKWAVPLQNSQVVLMVKTLNLTAPDPTVEGSILKTLKELIDLLQGKAIIICIDTKPSVELFTKVLPKSSGKFLQGPCPVSARLPEPFPDDLKNMYGCNPVLGARGVFFVWQKLKSSPPPLKVSTSVQVEVKEALSQSLPNIPHSVLQVASANISPISNSASKNSLYKEKTSNDYKSNIIGIDSVNVNTSVFDKISKNSSLPSMQNDMSHSTSLNELNSLGVKSPTDILDTTLVKELGFVTQPVDNSMNKSKISTNPTLDESANATPIQTKVICESTLSKSAKKKYITKQNSTLKTMVNTSASPDCRSSKDSVNHINKSKVTANFTLEESADVQHNQAEVICNSVVNKSTEMEPTTKQNSALKAVINTNTLPDKSSTDNINPALFKEFGWFTPLFDNSMNKSKVAENSTQCQSTSVANSHTSEVKCDLVNKSTEVEHITHKNCAFKTMVNTSTQTIAVENNVLTCPQNIIRNLTEKVQNLVSSFENELQNRSRTTANNYECPTTAQTCGNSCASFQTPCNHHSNEISTNGCSHNNVDVKNLCYGCYLNVRCCSRTHMSHHGLHGQNCFHCCCGSRNNVQPMFNAGNVPVPSIVIPLENVDSDLLCRLIMQAKANSSQLK